MGDTLPARYTGLAFFQSLSLAHLCQRDFVDTVEVTSRGVTWAASWLFAIAFLWNGDDLGEADRGRKNNGNKTDDFS